MNVKVIIKGNEDRNYDRLFAVLDKAAFLGRCNSLAERQTPEGYEVTLAYLNADVLDFLADNPKDYDVRS